MSFRRVSRQVVATGAFLSFDRLEIESPDGQIAERFMLSHPGAVAFLPVDGSDALLVSQYRGPVDQDLLEVPAGRLEPDDTDLREVVRRECVEEVGMNPGIIHPLGHIFTSGGITDERIDLFWVERLEPMTMQPDGIEEEHAVLVRIPVSDLERLVASLTDGKSIATIARYLFQHRA